MRTHTKRRRRSLDGVQHLWGFDNGHLTSVVPDEANMTLWRFVLLAGSGRLKISAPPGPDVIGSLRPVDVRRMLREIEALR